MTTWINGRLGSTLEYSDRGLQYGDGLFETMRVRDGQIRLLDLHLERLYAGLGRLKISAPALPLLRRELNKCAAGDGENVLKLIVTRGSPAAHQRPGYRPSGNERSTRIASLYALSPTTRGSDPDAAVRVRLCTTPLAINPALAGLKSLNRLESVLARSEWTSEQVWEGLMHDTAGNWVCGTMSNLFLRRGSVLTTPSINECGIAGVMRRWVLQAAPRLQLRARERQVRWRDLRAADEVFMTNAVVGIKSVRRIEAGDASVRLQEFAASRQLREMLAAQ